MLSEVPSMRTVLADPTLVAVAPVSPAKASVSAIDAVDGMILNSEFLSAAVHLALKFSEILCVLS